MKRRFKTKLVNNYLQPLRTQICELVSPNSKVLEVGCGDGDLLFQLSPKVKQAVGLDMDKELIDVANELKKHGDYKNLDFQVADVVHQNLDVKVYDCAIVSLVLHVLDPEDAQTLLHRLMKLADQVIVCGFSPPVNHWQRLLLWCDQRFSRHYRKFKMYQKKGYMKGLLADAGYTDYQEYGTFDPVIKLYLLN